MQRRAFLGGLSLLVPGCAPLVQTAGNPGGDFLGPRLEEDAFISFDGVRLPMTVWPAKGEPRGVIVALHGMNDYAGAFVLAAPIWAELGFTTYAYDQRGFGRAPHRGVWGGERLMTEDLRTAAALVRARHPAAVLAVVGESMGGAVAVCAFASRRPPTADRLVLIAPALWGAGSQAWIYRTTLWLGARTIGSTILRLPDTVYERIRASDNDVHLYRMGADPNMIFSTRIDTLDGLVALMHRASERMPHVKRPPPVLYCYGGKDQIIAAEPSFRAARSLKPGDRSAFYPHGFHMLTRDLAGFRVSRDIAGFIRDPAAPLPSGAGPIPGAPLVAGAREA